MGNNESSPSENAEGENVSAALVRLRLAKNKGDITQEQYDAGKPYIFSDTCIIFYSRNARIL
jgi:hypothetical protein